MIEKLLELAAATGRTSDKLDPVWGGLSRVAVAWHDPADADLFDMDCIYEAMRFLEQACEVTFEELEHAMPHQISGEHYPVFEDRYVRLLGSAFREGQGEHPFIDCPLPPSGMAVSLSRHALQLEECELVMCEVAPDEWVCILDYNDKESFFGRIVFELEEQ